MLTTIPNSTKSSPRNSQLLMDDSMIGFLNHRSGSTLFKVACVESTCCTLGWIGQELAWLLQKMEGCFWFSENCGSKKTPFSLNNYHCILMIPSCSILAKSWDSTVAVRSRNSYNYQTISTYHYSWKNFGKSHKWIRNISGVMVYAVY